MLQLENTHLYRKVFVTQEQLSFIMTHNTSDNVIAEKLNGDANSGTLEVEERRPIAYDPKEESRVVRKLDRVIMPLMAFVYFFQC